MKWNLWNPRTGEIAKIQKIPGRDLVIVDDLTGEVKRVKPELRTEITIKARYGTRTVTLPGYVLPETALRVWGFIERTDSNGDNEEIPDD